MLVIICYDFVSLGGTAMICLSDVKMEKFPMGTIWALIGAAAYALYLVTLKRKVKDDQQLDIPMFFGMSYGIESINIFFCYQKMYCLLMIEINFFC